MFTHEYTFEAARTPNDVFSYLADVARTPEWLSRCVEIKRTASGPLTTGEKLSYTYREGSRTGLMDGSVAVADAPRKLEFHYFDRMMKVKVGFDLAPAANGTSVRHSIEIAPQTWFFKLLQPVIRKATVKQTAKDMAKLKELLEKR